MKNISLHSKQKIQIKNESKMNKKAFTLTTEAILCLTILLISLNSIEQEKHPALTEEISQLQAQDIVETCIAKQEPKKQCFQKIEKINPSLEYSKEGKITVKRTIEGENKEINFKKNLKTPR